MSRYKVGDKVVTGHGGYAASLSSKVGEVVTIGQGAMPVGIRILGEYGVRWFKDSELTLIVDAPVSLVGKRVKLTLGESVIVGKMQSDKSAWYIVLVDGANEESSYRKDRWTVEVLPEPIVLPTGRNALVEVAGVVYRLEGNRWIFPKGFLWTRSLTDAATREGYRVIFEGE